MVSSSSKKSTLPYSCRCRGYIGFFFLYKPVWKHKLLLAPGSSDRLYHVPWSCVKICSILSFLLYSVRISFWNGGQKERENGIGWNDFEMVDRDRFADESAVGRNQRGNKKYNIDGTRYIHVRRIKLWRDIIPQPIYMTPIPIHEPYQI